MIKKDLKILLSKNKIQKVIDKLLSLTEIVNDNVELYNEVILLSSRYQSYLEAKRVGTIGFEEGQLQINRVNSSLIQIIEALPDAAVQTNTNKPVKKEDNVIELLIDQNFHDFDYSKKENLIGVIAGLLNIRRQEVLIRRVSMGSIKVAIEMPAKKAAALIMLFNSGISDPVLKDTFNIRSVALKTWIPGYIISLGTVGLAGICTVGAAGLALSMILYNQNNQLKNQLIENNKNNQLKDQLIENNKNNRDSSLIDIRNLNDRIQKTESFNKIQTDSLNTEIGRLQDINTQLLEAHESDEETIKNLTLNQQGKNQKALQNCNLQNKKLQERLTECNIKLAKALKSGGDGKNRNKETVAGIKKMIKKIQTEMLPNLANPKFTNNKKLNELRFQINDNLNVITNNLNSIQ